MSTADIRDAVTEAVDTARTAASAAVTVLSAGRQTTQDLRSLDAALTAAQGDIRAVRADLDGWDAEAVAVYDDASAILAGWLWERGVRWQLAAVDGLLHASLEATDALLAGRIDRTHVVRVGDTWQSIAARYLGDWREWPRLVALNGSTPAPVAVGTVLRIPGRV